MSRKYKFHNPSGAYFVSFATVNWVDVFIRQEYFKILSDSVDYCRSEKGMELFAYCFMPSRMKAKDRNNVDYVNGDDLLAFVKLGKAFSKGLPSGNVKPFPTTTENKTELLRNLEKFNKLFKGFKGAKKRTETLFDFTEKAYAENIAPQLCSSCNRVFNPFTNNLLNQNNYSEQEKDRMKSSPINENNHNQTEENK